MAGFFKWGSRDVGPLETEPALDVPEADPAALSKVLPRFLSALARQPAPVLLDLGPIVGANVTLFGERLACRLLVHDLYEELERSARDVTEAALTASLLARLPVEPESVDGIVCWDVFDYLDPPVSRALAAHLGQLLRRGGVLHAFFATAAVATDGYTRFIIESDDLICQRAYPARANHRRVLSPRDVDRMFSGLEMTDNVLLKSSTRETLFRKA